jgi:hypothetical protein
LQRLLLIITDAGRATIGVPADGQSEPTGAGRRPTVSKSKGASAPKAKAKKASSAALRSDSKQALLVDLLRRKEGATIAQAVKAAGWQPHSVRGAISGTLKRKLGLAVISDKVEGRGRVYRVVPK